MKATYDSEVDVARMVFRKTHVAESDEDRPAPIFDDDAEGNIVGLEIIDASKRTEDSRRIDYAEAG